MANPPHQVLRVEGLTKRFVLHARGTAIDALDGLDLEVRAGELVVLVGPSGAGKSSALKCIHRTYRPTGGRILLRTDDAAAPCDLAAVDDRTALEVRRRHIGYVSQFLHCLPRQPALDVVAAPLLVDAHGGDGADRPGGSDRAAARARAAEMLRRLAVPEALWELPPATFSGGEKQRVNIARGFVRPRTLLLLDEPTASLDAATAERVVRCIDEARSGGTAMLAILHDRDLVARIADRVVEMRPPARTSTPPAPA